MPIENFNKIEIKDTQINIHDKFLEPFNENEVIDIYGFFSNLNSEEKEKGCRIFNRKLADNINYSIYARTGKANNGEGLIFDFHILEDSNKQLSTLVFTEEFFNSENQKYLNMNHRRVETKNIGITGTDFLKKAEEYFSILKKQGILKEEKIGVHVSQASVLSWLLKNGFVLTNSNKDKFLRYFKINENNEIIKDENGKFVLNDEYTTLPLEDRHNLKDNGEYGEKDDYIINKKFITDPEYQDLRDRYYGNGVGKNLNKKVLIYDGGRRGGHIVNDLTNLVDVIPRFILEKQIR